MEKKKIKPLQIENAIFSSNVNCNRSHAMGTYGKVRHGIRIESEKPQNIAKLTEMKNPTVNDSINKLLNLFFSLHMRKHGSCPVQLWRFSFCTL